MNKALALIPVIFAIFALMVSPAVMSAYAGTENNGRTNGEKTADGCEKPNGKASDAGHNPNCPNNGGGTDPPETIDSVCDYDGDGSISAEDLVEVDRAGNITSAQGAIDQAEGDAGSKSDNNQVINNRTELRHLNHNLIDPC